MSANKRGRASERASEKETNNKMTIELYVLHIMLCVSHEGDTMLTQESKQKRNNNNKSKKNEKQIEVGPDTYNAIRYVLVREGQGDDFDSISTIHNWKRLYSYTSILLVHPIFLFIRPQLPQFGARRSQKQQPQQRCGNTQQPWPSDRNSCYTYLSVCQ